MNHDDSFSHAVLWGIVCIYIYIYIYIYRERERERERESMGCFIHSKFVSNVICVTIWV